MARWKGWIIGRFLVVGFLVEESRAPSHPGVARAHGDVGVIGEEAGDAGVEQREYLGLEIAVLARIAGRLQVGGQEFVLGAQRPDMHAKAGGARASRDSRFTPGSRAVVD